MFLRATCWRRSLLFAIAAACNPSADPPRRQWVVEISTDANVPQFGDRLLVEVLDDDGKSCKRCEREFGVIGGDASVGLGANAFPVSFGIIPPTSATTLHVRATFFRADQTGSAGRPNDSAHIEAVGRLPEASGVTHVSLALHMDCFGIPTDAALRRTCDPTTKMSGPEPVLARATPLVVGSWPPGVPRNCASASTDMACLAGGAFLIGSRSIPVVVAERNAFPVHLVVLQPFLLDLEEVTVGTVRTLLTLGSLPLADAPTQHSSDALAKDWGCKYLGLLDNGNDAYAASCLDHFAASHVCAALGKRLPTEAEWEYAARNMTTSTDFPWGDDGNICAKALVGRGRSNVSTAPDVYESGACRTYLPNQVLPPGPVVGGSALDFTALGIHNMGGSVSEWVDDTFAAYTDPCWSSSIPLNDPRCEVSMPPFLGIRAIRGASWLSEASSTYGSTRNGDVESFKLPSTGLRCAKDQ